MKYKSQFIILIVCLKVCLFVFLVQQFQSNHSERLVGHFFVKKGETLTYTSPVEHLLNGDGYSLVSYNQANNSFILQPSARRMPGMVPILLPLRIVMPENIALNGLILIQFALSLLSIFLLGMIVFHYTASRIVSLVAVLLYTLSSFASIYDHLGLAESLSISFCVMSVYLFVRYIKEASYSLLFAAGFFLTWSVFLRPAVVILAPLMAIELLLTFNKKYSIREVIKRQFILFSFLTIALSVWTARNLVHFNSLIVFEDSVFDSMPHIYTPAEKALRPLINHWGGQRKKFYPNTMGAYFYDQTDDQSVFPEIIFSPAFNRDSLDRFKTLFQNAHEAKNDSILINTFINKSMQLRNEFKVSHPFYYHMYAPIKSLVRFFFIKTENQLPFPVKSEMSLFQYLFKAFNIILYNLIAIFALFGFIIFSVKKGRISFILSFPLIYCFALGCILYNTEVRYLASVFPFLLVLAAVTMHSIFNLFPRLTIYLNKLEIK